MSNSITIEKKIQNFIKILKDGIEKNVDEPNYKISKSAKYSEFYEDSQKWYRQDCL